MTTPPGRLRLTKSNDIRAVFRSGKRVGDGQLRVIFRANGLDHPRFCVPIGRKVSKKAVVRNRIRRRIREAFRGPLGQLNQGVDLVVLAQRTIADLPWDELTNRSHRLINRLSA